MWAEECQKAAFPSSSFQVKSFKSPLVSRVVEASTMVSLNRAESTFLANPSLISLATSKTVSSFSYLRTDPSGRVIAIIL